MNNEKQIARAILEAQKMREISYIPNVDPGKNKTNYTFGEYELGFEECFIATCKKAGLSSNIWSLLCLANHGCNDIRLWAEDVLAGKNILEEAEKENAKVEEMKVFAKLTKINKELNEKKKAVNETESDGNLLDSHRR